ncbi:hypothetical protein [Dysgonomonas sp.]
MKNCLVFLFFVLTCFSIHAQSKKDLISIWDGGEAFSGMYEEKNFLIEFTESSFHIQYGLNHYTQYTGYTLKKDTLIITRSKNKNRIYQPHFKIIKLDASELILEAINWAAVYITSVLSTPYVGCADEDAMVNNTDKDLTGGNILNIRLTFKRVQKTE